MQVRLDTARDVTQLGAILEDLGVVGATDALLVRYEQEFGDTRRLGEILVAQGLATQDQIDAALEIQGRTSPHVERRSREATMAAHSAQRRIRNIQSIAMFVVSLIGVVVITRLSGGIGSWYGIGAVSLLALKLFGSAVYRPVLNEAPATCRVAVVVAVYNEDPIAFARCLDSIKAQTRPADEIWIIDDGSTDNSSISIAERAFKDTPGAVVHRFDRNSGKRHAQGYAFVRTTSDIVVTIDSDTVLDSSAIAEGLRPFSDPGVTGVAANVRALNHRRNLLTRLIDLRYANAFQFERAAYSTVGSVVCCCGSLSFFRTDVVRANIDDFLHQSFLGVQVQYGDDRRLTQYALQQGRVQLQDTSIAYTLVPETLGHYRRQQLRWNKSFFRESLWAIRRFGPQRWPFWISVAELAVWIVFTVSLLANVYVRPLVTGELIPWSYIAFAVVLAYARNVRYFGRPNESVRGQLATFASAPLYTVLHVVLLTPLRVWSLLTLRQTGWGTRAKVEVRGS
ncbi:MAG: glycosyltransferase [Actinomycetia bacterium]|nr:glycosyltransferase [Actinomycetes bacterium]